MDQSKSTESEKDEKPQSIDPPKRTLTTEFLVGVFMLIGLIALAYQAVGLAGIEFFSSNSYYVQAEFDNVAGLQPGAPVEVAGVAVGEVADITLKDPEAVVHMRIYNPFQIRDDDIASIRTKGIIGDRYLKISRGASDIFLEPGDIMTETESVVDIEDLIGKFVHSMGGEDDEE